VISLVFSITWESLSGLHPNGHAIDGFAVVEEQFFSEFKQKRANAEVAMDGRKWLEPGAEFAQVGETS
jgi:hypothetical protein